MQVPVPYPRFVTCSQSIYQSCSRSQQLFIKTFFEKPLDFLVAWFNVSDMTVTWKRIQSKCLKNLHVAFDVQDRPVGMIEKPSNTKNDKNFYRMYIGVGDNARFLGHAVNKKQAMNHVHWAICLNAAEVKMVS